MMQVQLAVRAALEAVVRAVTQRWLEQLTLAAEAEAVIAVQQERQVDQA
mgnify:CR=1 FL=1